MNKRLGYREIGVLDEVDRKMGQYWSTMILEALRLAQGRAKLIQPTI